MSTHQLLHERATERYGNCCDEAYPLAVDDGRARVLLFDLYVIQNGFFALKWRHIACSIDIILSVNPGIRLGCAN